MFMVQSDRMPDFMQGSALWTAAETKGQHLATTYTTNMRVASMNIKNRYEMLKIALSEI